MVETQERSVASDIALIVGGGPGISASCARLFAKQGMKVAVARCGAGSPSAPVGQNPYLSDLAETRLVLSMRWQGRDEFTR